MNGLALCAGIGGIELGLHIAYPDYRTICFVEGEAYPAACLVARMEEGSLDPAPLWSDIRTFDGEPWRGTVDIISAGYPCQPFSLAGKRLGEKDPRHLWPEVARIVGEVEPPIVFLENVPGHIKNGLSAVRDDLQELGYCVAPPILTTAAELGAGHIRKRLFCLAIRKNCVPPDPDEGTVRDPKQRGEGKALPTLSGSPVTRNTSAKRVPRGHRLHSDSDSGGREVEWHPEHERQGTHGKESDGSTPPTRGLSVGEESPHFWASEPGMERVVHGIPYRVDRDRALGNAVVPIMAAYAFRRLFETF